MNQVEQVEHSLTRGGPLTKRRIAWHEAFHAVTARMQGIEVVSVLMFRTDESTPASTFSRSAAYDAKRDTTSRIAALEIDIRVALAGPVGDALYSKGRPQSRKMREGATDDIARSQSLAIHIALLMAGEAVPELPPGERAELEVSLAIVESANAILRRLREETKAFLTEHWAAVERVAQALMTCNLLDQAELDRLIEPLPPVLGISNCNQVSRVTSLAMKPGP